VTVIRTGALAAWFRIECQQCGENYEQGVMMFGVLDPSKLAPRRCTLCKSKKIRKFLVPTPREKA